MEFTVSKSDLVRELSLSQGVVEKRTTIPILSNVLLEAAGERLVLALPGWSRKGPGPSRRGGCSTTSACFPTPT
jgi:hypothetical protein